MRIRIPSSSPDDLMFFYIANYLINAVLVFSISVIAPYCTNFLLQEIRIQRDSREIQEIQRLMNTVK